MPDSNSEWTADESFWNEAWADMQDRLNRKRRRRMILLPWILGIGLLLGGGALVLYLSQDPISEPVASSRTEIPGETNPQAPTNPADTAKSVRILPTEKAQNTEGQSTEVRTPVRGTSTKPAQAPPAISGSDSRWPGSNQRKSIPSNLPASPKDLAPAPRSPKNLTGVRQTEEIVSDLPQAVFTLLMDNPDLPEVKLGEEEKTFSPVDGGGPYALAAGATGYVSSFIPGGYLQFSRRFGRGKWFVPLMLRYDYARRTVSVSDTENLAEALNLAAADVDPTTADRLNRRLDENNSNLVKTHSLELRTGIGRQLGKRVNLAMGGGVSYLVGGSGPIISNLGNGNYYALTVQNNRLDFMSRNSANYSPASGSTQQSVLNNTINRIIVNGWLNANYQISTKFSFTLGLTHHISSFYQSDAILMESTRIEIGALRRF